MAENVKKGFLDRTLAQIRNAWKDIAGRGKFVRPDLPDDDIDRFIPILIPAQDQQVNHRVSRRINSWYCHDL